MTTDNRLEKMNSLHNSDWELDFYSRPILEPDGKKRWELLICSPQALQEKESFRWEKRCPASEVNSIWLANALREAIDESKNQGLDAPLRLRCWRTSMQTMVKRAALEVGLEVISSRRTYNLVEWLLDREKNLYPQQEGYMVGPLAPPPAPITNEPIPLPEAVRGDALTLASLPLGLLRDANEWPIEFSGLLHVDNNHSDSFPVPGLRMFSKSRSLALAGWLGSLEPVRLFVKGRQLILEAGQDDLWLVTDLDKSTADATKKNLIETRHKAGGLQFIAIQSSPEVQKFSGFWMLKDLTPS